MRYIVNAAGYVKNISFGACITCGGVSCTEYEGVVPEGFDSLEAWYLAECEYLYRWKIVHGNLTRDDEAEAPSPEYAFAKKDLVVPQTLAPSEWHHWPDEGCYRLAIVVYGVKAESVVDISLAATATAEQAKAYMQLGLQPGEQMDGAITLRAFGKKPTVSIPIVIVVRDYGAGTATPSAAVSFDDGTLSLL
jgi:hypothetical protein